ncbi:MAG: SDR family oxidoreductase [Chitinophagaceae bacterium]|nr:MAG: dTDP-4-dehydrorhamnose reductase [Bacteroidetes bacterium OLB11]MCC6448736.1 SDR family oxidoreductase [Chitinophagaceae bacterium]HMN32858.1 SDR family oxidoreductase [Chitinophagaceae bacterium]
MKVFISGASGLVGGNCFQYFKEMKWDVVGTHFNYATPNTFYFNTLDLENENNFQLKKFQPDVIVHCGALTHVDYCENHKEESYEKTVISTKNLIKIAALIQAKLVYISTDYVFDGKDGPYKETDATNPLSVYAKHKLEAEQIVLNASEKHLVLRITNVYGDEYRNKNFVSRIIHQCIQREKIILNLPYDQYASPVNAYDVARAMYQLLNDNQGGVFHIASTDYMNRVDLALRVLQYFPDADYQLSANDTNSLKQTAPRPLLAGLLKNKFSSLYPEFVFSNVDDYVSKVIEMRSKN